MKSTQLEGYISVQTENNGYTTEERLKAISESQVPSAKALYAALMALEEKTSDKDGQDASDEKKSDTDSKEHTRSTETYHFKIDSLKALEALQVIDKTGNTPAYDAKFAKYVAVRQSVGNPKDLPLTRRIEALKQLNTVSFVSYSIQVTFKVPDPGIPGGKSIRSRKHHRCDKPSEKTVKAFIDAYISEWLNSNPKDKTSQSPSIEGIPTPGSG